MNTQHASPDFIIGMHLQVDPAVDCILSRASRLINPIAAVHGQNNSFEDLRMDCRQPFPYPITEGLPVIREKL